jgi:lysophospholipase L1-like esterase
MDRILCFGDSVTASTGCAEGQSWPSLVHQHLEANSSQRWKVFNLGVPGNTTWQALDRFTEDIQPLLPGYVLVQFGLNDASIPPGRLRARCDSLPFGQNLREIIDLVRVGGGIPILLTNHQIRDESRQGNGATYRENYCGTYPSVIRRIASETSTPLIDLEDMMNAAKLDLDQLLHEDGLHLSPSGHLIYASFVSGALLEILNNNHQSSCLN